MADLQREGERERQGTCGAGCLSAQMRKKPLQERDGRSEGGREGRTDGGRERESAIDVRVRKKQEDEMAENQSYK